MTPNISPRDFEWKTDNIDVHKERRLEMLKKYPEIKELYGVDENFKWICTCIVFVQISSLYFLQDKSIPVLFVVAYFFGSSLSRSLHHALHDIVHNCAFGHSRYNANKLFGMFCNLGIGFPMFIDYKKHHINHHLYLSDEILDIDLPTKFEATFFTTRFRKLLYVTFFPIVLINRIYFQRAKPLVKFEILNRISCYGFSFLVGYLFGWKMTVYLIGSYFISLGLHPMAGTFIAVHCMFVKGIETYSYYGPINWITFNTGYHTEHHDFPDIPGSRLPMVRKIAPEFYDNLPYHTSYLKVIYDFIMDPNIGPSSRVKRKTKLQFDSKIE